MRAEAWHKKNEMKSFRADLFVWPVLTLLFVYMFQNCFPNYVVLTNELNEVLHLCES